MTFKHNGFFFFFFARLLSPATLLKDLQPEDINEQPDPGHFINQPTPNMKVHVINLTHICLLSHLITRDKVKLRWCNKVIKAGPSKHTSPVKVDHLARAIISDQSNRADQWNEAGLGSTRGLNWFQVLVQWDHNEMLQQQRKNWTPTLWTDGVHV